MSDSDSSEPPIPTELQVRYNVRLTCTVAENVAAAYDVTVEVPLGTPEATITAQATAKFAERIAAVPVAELTPCPPELDAVVLDAAHREQVPATLSTIEFGEQIRYQHHGRRCDGTLFHVEVSPAQSARLEALVIATQIDGTATSDRTVHRIPLGNIDAHLEARDG